MTWKHVVALLIFMTGLFFMSWQAPLVTVLLFGVAGWYANQIMERCDED